MKILVTGNKGYIGSVMVPKLQENGFEVAGIDSDLYENCKFGDQSIYGANQNIPYAKKDLRNVEPSDLRGIDAVIHLAALSNDPLGDFNPDITNEINFKSSAKLAKLSKKAGVNRFIFSSSCSVYGASTTDIVDEQSELNPVTAYGSSKALAEKEILKLADPSFHPTIMRSATAYGVSPALRTDVVLNNLVGYACVNGKVYLKSDGTAWRPIVHIEDISQAFIATLKSPADLVHGETFNVGQTKENYRIKEIAQIVKDTVPNSQIAYAEGAEHDKRSYRVNFSKIETKLANYKPTWNARLGAKQLYNAYKKFNLTADTFEGPRYKRIGHLLESVRNGVLDQNLRKKSD